MLLLVSVNASVTKQYHISVTNTAIVVYAELACHFTGHCCTSGLGKRCSTFGPEPETCCIDHYSTSDELFRRANSFIFTAVIMNYHAIWITCKGTATTHIVYTADELDKKQCKM